MAKLSKLSQRGKLVRAKIHALGFVKVDPISIDDVWDAVSAATPEQVKDAHKRLDAAEKKQKQRLDLMGRGVLSVAKKRASADALVISNVELAPIHIGRTSKYRSLRMTKVQLRQMDRDADDCEL
jgi:hypothetical protein